MDQNATPVQRSSPFSVSSTRPPSTLWRRYFMENMVTVSSMVLKEPFGISNFPNAFVLMKDVVGWVNAWTTQHCTVDPVVAPAESHRLTLVERRHITLRRAIEIYMDGMRVSGLSGIRQALTYVVSQLNDTMSVAGYTPLQWLLGKMLRLLRGFA